MSNYRQAFDEAVSNMAIASSPYFKDYVYYLHILSQCKVVFDTTLPAVAGVSFKKDHYVLYINPSEIIGETEKGPILGFTTDMPIQHRIGIIKHEMMHICLGHLINRLQDRNFMLFNFSSDCALDQHINRDHLPDYAIYPDNFPAPEAKKHLNESAEFYYNLLEEYVKENSDEQGEGQGEGNKFNGTGCHETWMECEGDEVIQTELTKQMVEKAGIETQKSKGRLPSNYSEMLENLTIRREVNWKQVLRRIVGNKKANIRKTLLRRDRRLPNANWIKGTTKDRVFELGVISDVSGSVSSESLVSLWGEIISICDLFKTPVTMVQVDTEPSEPEELNKKTKAIERKASGGTFLSPAIDKFKEKRKQFDALVVTTDGHLFDDDIVPFQELKVPVIWLIEPNGNIMSEMNQGKMRAIRLT